MNSWVEWHYRFTWQRTTPSLIIATKSSISELGVNAFEFAGISLNLASHAAISLWSSIFNIITVFWKTALSWNRQLIFIFIFVNTIVPNFQNINIFRLLLIYYFAFEYHLSVFLLFHLYYPEFLLHVDYLKECYNVLLIAIRQFFTRLTYLMCFSLDHNKTKNTVEWMHIY